jgi:hypothetical protein
MDTDTEWADKEQPKFIQQLNTAYNNNNGKTLNNPNPSTSLRNGVTVVTPIYITLLGDHTKSGTALNSIYTEYDTKISASVTFTKQAQQAASQVSDNITPISNQINNVISILKNFNTKIQDIDTKVISKAITYVIIYFNI